MIFINMNLKQTIRRILKEEDYSPAGKEIIPNKIVVHKSNPMFRDKILQDGLKVRAGECYKIYVGYGIKCRPAIFATNSTNKRAWFDSTYDDDIWEINTEMIPDVKWFKDRHYESRSKHIVTFQDIPVDAITLKYKGTGSGDYKLWSKDSPNRIQESHKEKGNEKANLVRKMIHNLYDNVSFIEQSTFNGKPHLMIYFDSDDTAANIESWFDEKISTDIKELTSGIIVVCPDWAANWDSRKKEADVYINTELLRYDNLGNVINESSKSIRRILREEMEFSFGFRRRIETFKAIVWNNFATNYPCDYDDFSHFMRGVRQEIKDVILEGENDGEPISDWLTLKEAEDYIEKYMIDDLKELYVSRCLE